METFLTICTPTYNRESTLGRLYDSLIKQTNFKFEWIIIDDGSTDHTQELVEKWRQKKNNFPITYQKQENGGKHRAINRGVAIASGTFFFIVDSDDYLTPDAVEKILEKSYEINPTFAGIAFCKGYFDQKIVGTTFVGDSIDATTLERNKYHINGDKAEVFYTEILRKNKFPEFEGEKFLTEAVVWNRIASQGYPIRWYQDIIYLCEYRDDGLTKLGYKKFVDSPKGLLLFIKENIEMLHLSLPRRLMKYAYYSKAVYDNKNIEQASKDLEISKMTLRIAIWIRNMITFIRKK